MIMPYSLLVSSNSTSQSGHSKGESCTGQWFVDQYSIVSQQISFIRFSFHHTSRRQTPTAQYRHSRQSVAAPKNIQARKLFFPLKSVTSEQTQPAASTVTSQKDCRRSGVKPKQSM